MERIGDSEDFKTLMSDMFKKYETQFSNYGVSKEVFEGINNIKDKKEMKQVKSYYDEYVRQNSGKHITKIYSGQKLSKIYKSYPVMNQDGDLINEISTTYDPKNPDKILFDLKGLKQVYELIDFESGGIKIKCLVPTDKELYHTGGKEKLKMPDDIFEGMD